MKTLRNYLEDKNVEEGLIAIMETLALSIKQISEALRFGVGDDGKVGTKNVYGEEQLKMDLLSNQILTDNLSNNQYMAVVASEEMDGEKKVGDGEYAVCYDPLDGSSLADVNLSVGTILGIYKKNSFLGVKGDDQIAAMIAVYGPSTTVLLTVRQGVAKFILGESGVLSFVCDGLEVAKEGRMFAPGNLRACKYSKDYLALMNYWCENEYTLRYSGGMVPDINQIVLKGKGIFTYPGYEKEPEGKLRLLFECAPMALIMEQAKGYASDGKNRILDLTIDNLEKRTPIFIGSEGEVRRAVEFFSEVL